MSVFLSVLSLFFCTLASANELVVKSQLTARSAEIMLSNSLQLKAVQSLNTLLPKNSFEVLVDVKFEDETDLKRVSANPAELMASLESFNQKKNVLIVVDPDDLPLGDRRAPMLARIQETLAQNLNLNLWSKKDAMVVREAQLDRNVASEKAKQLALNAAPFYKMSFFWLSLLSIIAFVLSFFGYRHFGNWFASKGPGSISETENTRSTPSNDA